MTREFMSCDEKKLPVKNIGTHFIYGGKNSYIISRINSSINENEQSIAQKKACSARRMSTLRYFSSENISPSLAGILLVIR